MVKETNAPYRSRSFAVFTSTLFFGAVGLYRSDMLCLLSMVLSMLGLLSMVLSMRFNVKMVLSIYIQLTLRDRNSMLCLLSPWGT